MKTYNTLFWGLLTLFFSCQSDNLKPDLPPKSGSYISSYITKIQSISTEQVAASSLVRLNFLMLGESATYNSQSFKQIAEFYNDTNYNGHSLPTNISVLSDSIKSIHFFAMEDYNDSYKKNDKIDDIVKIEFENYFDFIKSHYQNSIQTKFKMYLNDFNAGTYKLFVSGFIIELTEIPTLSGSYPLKIGIETSSDYVELLFVIHV